MEMKSFESMEEMQAFMAEQEAAAIAAITEEQRAIKPGDCWASPRPEYGCVIFGKSKTLAEIEAAERSYHDPDADVDEHEIELKELRWTLDSQRDAHERGYLFGTAWSTLEPRGELGSTHVSQMHPITEAMLEEARAHDWDFKACVVDGLPWAMNLAAGLPAATGLEE